MVRERVQWRSQAGYTVEVRRLSMTCRRHGHGKPADPAGHGEQFVARLPGGRVVEYSKCQSRLQQLVPDFDRLQETGRRRPLLVLGS